MTVWKRYGKHFVGKAHVSEFSVYKSFSDQQADAKVKISINLWNVGSMKKLRNPSRISSRSRPKVGKLGK